MTGVSPRFWELFFEVYTALPRQGPGNCACASRALDLCQGLPPSPAILDLGCGIGAQTLHLAELTSGSIVALDHHPAWITKLKRRATERGLCDRIDARVGDMTQLVFEPESFDLIWSEGALYNIGIENALQLCRPLLRRGGHLAFSDAVWKGADPPAEVRASFDFDYPSMGWAADILEIIVRCGYELRGHFTLPDEAWWDDFYTPMTIRVTQLLEKYQDDPEALEVLEQLAQEPELHRTYAGYYGYEFFVARRPD
jgi:ubiquinone/menaquinone biosynthesis C-methylase UbiE